MWFTPRAAGRRIAQTALLTALATLGAASPSFATSYFADHADGATAFWSLDDAVGSATADDLVGTADGAYRNRVVTRRDALVACERKGAWNSATWTSNGCAFNTNFWSTGYAAYFDQVSNPYVEVSSGLTPQNDVDDAVSYAAWVDPVGTGGTVIDYGNNGQLSVSATTASLTFQTSSGPVTLTQALVGSGPHFVGAALSEDPITHSAVLYADGGSSSSPAIPVLSGSPAFYISNASTPFHGTIDNVAYWGSTAVTTTTFGNEYAGGQMPDPTTGRILTLTPHDGAVWYTNSPKQLRLGITCANTTLANCYATVGATTYHDGDLLPAGVGSYTIKGYADDGVNPIYGPSLVNYTVGNSFKNVIANDAPIHYWRFDDPDPALQAFDESTGTSNAYYMNGSALGTIGVTGDSSRARKFRSGDGSYIGINDVPAGSRGFTFEGWVLPDDITDMAIFDHGASGGGPAVYIKGKKVTFDMPDGVELQSGVLSNYDASATSTFTHVAATWDGVIARLYVNGVQVDSKEASKAPSGTPTLYVGFANVGLSQPTFRGLIDEVSYYSKALSGERVHEHYLADPPAVRQAAEAPASVAPAVIAATADSSKAAAPDKAAAAKKARAQAKARAKAKAKARAKALKRAKARAKAKRAKARGHHRSH